MSLAQSYTSLLSILRNDLPLSQLDMLCINHQWHFDALWKTYALDMLLNCPKARS